MFSKRVSISLITVGHVVKKLGLDVFRWSRGDGRHKHRMIKIHRPGLSNRFDSNN